MEDYLTKLQQVSETAGRWTLVHDGVHFALSGEEAAIDWTHTPTQWLTSRTAPTKLVAMRHCPEWSAPDFCCSTKSFIVDRF